MVENGLLEEFLIGNWAQEETKIYVTENPQLEF